MTDKEYLQRSLVPGLQFELSDTRIRIVSDNTIFIHYLAVNKFVQEDVLKEYKELGAKMDKGGFDKDDVENIESYFEWVISRTEKLCKF